jgi:hypothetical protein
VIGTKLRTAAVVVAACAATLFGVTATPAAADPLPPNCSFTTPNFYTGSLTCTGMASTTRWQLALYCMAWPPYWVPGNIVTGNGTSTQECWDGGWVHTGEIWYV